MSFHRISLTINGELERADVSANMTLLDLLRETLVYTGTKNGCSAGECGACTVMMDGEPVNSCLVLAVECDGAEILTVEGLAQDSKLDPIQEAFVDHSAFQCGFCTPGMLMTAKGFLAENPHPKEAEVRHAIAGNLCRCTGYNKYVEAILDAADRMED